MYKRVLILIMMVSISISLTGCFKDKGGAGAGSILNLTPEQKLHATMRVLAEQKVLEDDKALKKEMTRLEKTLKDASGEIKYKVIYYLSFIRVYYADLMSKKKKVDRREGRNLLRFAQKDINHFKKGRYMLNDQRFLTGLIQSLRLIFETDIKKRLKSFEVARTNLLYLLEHVKKFETEFKIQGVALSKPDVLLSLARLYRLFNDPFKAFETHEKIKVEFPIYYQSPIAKIERGYLYAMIGDYQKAISATAEFKGSIFRNELFYDEGLWLIHGIYKILSKDNNRYSIDEKVLKKALKERGGFYGKSAGPLGRYLKIREKSYFAYGKALELYFENRYDEALKILYDIVDDKKATSNRFLALDSSRSTLKLANFLISKCLEETGDTSQADINLYLENADYYNYTAEVDFSSVELKTKEIDINIDSLLPKITGETKLNKKRGRIRRPNFRGYNPKCKVQ